MQRLLVLPILLAATGCGSGDEIAPSAASEPTPPAAPVAGTHGSVPERLAAIAANADPARNPYLNAARAERLEADARRAAPGPQRFQLLVRAVLERIRAGEPERGLALLDEAEALLRSSGAEIQEDTRAFLLTLRALGGLRLGEQENCLAHHSSASCTLPIRAEAVHAEARGARLAQAALRDLLALRPGDVKARWLLDLTAMTLGEYPDGVPEEFRLPAEALAAGGALPRFEDAALRLGVGVRGLSGGVVMEDLDGDGRMDLVTSSWGLDDPLHFFVQTADGRFEERTGGAGLSGQLGGLNLSHADYDNDGDADLLVLRGAWLFDAGNIPNSLLRNDGGTFTDVTEAAGLLELVPSHVGSWADFDGDGWLDLFVGNEPSDRRRHASRLMRNQGDGTFRDVSTEVGLDVSGIVKAGAWGDYDEDGRPDLYVSRFGEPNLLLHNTADGFQDVTAAAGVGEPVNSFPAWFFDFDGDGHQDLFVASFGGFDGDNLEDVVAPLFGEPSGGTTAHLYRNRGDGTFEDVSARAGLDRVVLAMGANFGDLDNDGWLDIALGTGEPQLSTLVPNLLFRNDAGRRFQDVTFASGFGNLQKGHGIAFGDVDRDGDQDLYVVLGGAYEGDVYPNQLLLNPGDGNHWLTLRFHGVRANRAAMGARVRVVVRANGTERDLWRIVGTGGSFGSSTLQLEVGLGRAEAVPRVEITWPGSGTRSTYRDVAMDRVWLAREGREALEAVE